MPTLPQCDASRFTEKKDGGLQVVRQTVASAFRKNYQKLTKLLGSAEPKRSQQVPQALLKKIFRTEGYYIGKEQLKCLLDTDFAEYEGIRIKLGLNQDPVTGRGIAKLVFLIEGVFPSDAEPQGTVGQGDNEVDARFHNTPSPITYLAGTLPSGPTPGPGSRESPPY